MADICRCMTSQLTQPIMQQRWTRDGCEKKDAFHKREAKKWQIIKQIHWDMFSKVAQTLLHPFINRCSTLWSMSRQLLQRIKKRTKPPSNCRKHTQMAEKWKIFTSERQQRNGKVQKKLWRYIDCRTPQILLHPFFYRFNKLWSMSEHPWQRIKKWTKGTKIVP